MNNAHILFDNVLDCLIINMTSVAIEIKNRYTGHCMVIDTIIGHKCNDVGEKVFQAMRKHTWYSLCDDWLICAFHLLRGKTTKGWSRTRFLHWRMDMLRMLQTNCVSLPDQPSIISAKLSDRQTETFLSATLTMASMCFFSVSMSRFVYSICLITSSSWQPSKDRTLWTMYLIQPFTLI